MVWYAPYLLSCFWDKILTDFYWRYKRKGHEHVHTKRLKVKERLHIFDIIVYDIWYDMI